MKPLAGRPPAVNLTALTMQMNAVATKPEVFVERQFVRVLFGRRGMGHHVAQPAPKGWYLDLSECHCLVCQPPALCGLDRCHHSRVEYVNGRTTSR
jgi:hypothetical protein